jgi:hypothetical protein
MEDEVEYECPECGEPVDNEGESLDPVHCEYGSCACESCGGGRCDQSC